MSEVLLETIDITKHFGGTIANDHVSIRILKGEVHAIVGENGAGKSTFCKILSGVLPPDKGKIILNGKEIKISSPSDAIRKGISMVYQERNLVPDFTGAQNIFLGDEPVRARAKFLIDEEKLYKQAEEILNSFDENVKIDFPLNVPVRILNPGQQQFIEILRALRFNSQLLLLDEPTASLGKKESEILFNVIRRIVNDGITVVFISHKLDEVFAIADTISIFRNGQCVASKERTSLTKEECIRLMVNRDISQAYPEYQSSRTDEVILKLENVSDEYGEVKNVNFVLRKGEIVGWYGLVGSGRSELAQVIYGLRKKKTGSIVLEEHNLEGLTTADIMSKGVFLIPEDRNRYALFPSMDLGRNTSIAYLDELASLMGYISPEREKKTCLSLLNSKEISVKYRDLSDDIDSLSGGNKQKVVLCRVINKNNLKVLIADEVTQGIDVGTKYDIYILLHNLAKKGTGIIFISSELPELIGVCDRICVFYRGRIVTTLERHQFDNDLITSYALGLMNN